MLLQDFAQLFALREDKDWKRAAEVLIETFGADRVFNGLNSEPEKVKEVLGSGRRTEILLDAWERDYRRRTSAGTGEKQPVS